MPNTAKHLIGSLQQGNPVTDDFDYGRVMTEALERAKRANAYKAPAGQPTVDFVTEVQALCRKAGPASGYREQVAAGGITTGFVKASGVAVRELDIRSTLFSAKPNDDFEFHATARLPGETNTLSASIILNSLVSQAGARIIVTAPRPAPTTSDVLALYPDAGVFRLVEAAQYAHVPDGEEVTESGHPFFNAPIPMDDSVSYAFRTKITRKQLNDVGGSRTHEALTNAITLGLANLADKVLLDAIIATSPQAYSLAKAAARGLRFHELRALVGTAANGASIDNGKLYVSGVNAELTPAVTGTVVGAFNRAAVAVSPYIQLHTERLNLNGDVYVTTWANMVPLIPDATAFWTVS